MTTTTPVPADVRFDVSSISAFNGEAYGTVRITAPDVQVSVPMKWTPFNVWWHSMHGGPAVVHLDGHAYAVDRLTPEHVAVRGTDQAPSPAVRERLTAVFTAAQEAFVAQVMACPDVLDMARDAATAAGVEVDLATARHATWLDALTALEAAQRNV